MKNPQDFADREKAGAERTMSGIDWDAVEERTGTSRRPKMYASNICIRCGRTIREGAFGSRDSNFKRHSRACERKNG